jgi:hypothetical protein
MQLHDRLAFVPGKGKIQHINVGIRIQPTSVVQKERCVRLQLQSGRNAVLHLQKGDRVLHEIEIFFSRSVFLTDRQSTHACLG